MNIQDWSPLGRTGWISLQSKGLLGVFSNTTVQKHQFFLFCGAGQIYVHFTATTLVFIIIIGVEFPYNIVLVSAVPQPESAVSMRTPPLLTPSPPHPSRSSRSSQLSSLGYTAASHYLSILYMVVCMSQCYSKPFLFLAKSPWTCADFLPWVRAREANSTVLLHMKCFHNITALGMF